MEAIDFIILQIFFATLAVFKIGEYVNKAAGIAVIRGLTYKQGESVNRPYLYSRY